MSVTLVLALPVVALASWDKCVLPDPSTITACAVACTAWTDHCEIWVYTTGGNCGGTGLGCTPRVWAAAVSKFKRKCNAACECPTTGTPIYATWSASC